MSPSPSRITGAGVPVNMEVIRNPLPPMSDVSSSTSSSSPGRPVGSEPVPKVATSVVTDPSAVSATTHAS